MTPHTDGSLDNENMTAVDHWLKILELMSEIETGAKALEAYTAAQVRQGIIDQLRSLPDDDHTPIPVEYVHYLADYHAAKLAALQSDGADSSPKPEQSGSHDTDPIESETGSTRVSGKLLANSIHCVACGQAIEGADNE